MAKPWGRIKVCAEAMEALEDLVVAEATKAAAVVEQLAEDVASQTGSVAPPQSKPHENMGREIQENLTAAVVCTNIGAGVARESQETVMLDFSLAKEARGNKELVLVEGADANNPLLSHASDRTAADAGGWDGDNNVDLDNVK